MKCINKNDENKKLKKILVNFTENDEEDTILNDNVEKIYEAFQTIILNIDSSDSEKSKN